MKTDSADRGWVKGKREYARPKLKAILSKDVLKVSGEQEGGGPVRPIEDGGKITFQ